MFRRTDCHWNSILLPLHPPLFPLSVKKPFFFSCLTLLTCFTIHFFFFFGTSFIFHFFPICLVFITEMFDKPHNATQLCDYGPFFINFTTLTKFQKKWHLAFVVIYSSRGIVSAAHENIAKMKNPVFSMSLRVPSYTALDIQLNGDDCSSYPVRFSYIDQKQLTEIVKHKNLDLLCSARRCQRGCHSSPDRWRAWNL